MRPVDLALFAGAIPDAEVRRQPEVVVDYAHTPDALDKVRVPVLLLGGWQDIFLRQTLQQAARPNCVLHGAVRRQIEQYALLLVRQSVDHLDVHTYPCPYRAAARLTKTSTNVLAM